MTGRGTIDFFLTKNRDMLSRASIMADQKASIILGSEFIILTLIISGIWSPKGGDAAQSVPPLWSVVLVISILASVLFALFVLVPSLSFKKKNKQDGGQKKSGSKSRLLFFSAIAEMDQADYVNEMKELLEDDEKIYEAILVDMHNESRVLKNKKFHYLKISYLTLILGIPVSIFVFILESRGIIDSPAILGPLLNS